MENLPFNATDIAVVVIILVSGLLALVRGFVKELLSVGAWIGAAVVALYAFPHVQPYTRDLISVPFAADATAAVGVFVITLVILSALTHWIAGHVRQSHFSRMDRALGFLFGLVRGAVVICLLWLLVDWVIEPENQPVWITEAETLPLIQGGATLLANLVPEDVRARGAAVIEDAERAVESEAGRRLNGGDASSPGGVEPQGYEPEQRQNMDNLIEQNQ